MVYRNKTYVAFDGDRDIIAYRLMTAWKQSDNTDFNFYDAHDLNDARDSSSEESIKAQLRVRMANSKLFVLLVGENTAHLTKFVKWEIQSAIRRQLPIVVVMLEPTNPIPSYLNDYLYIKVPFKAKQVERAMTNWPDSFAKHLQDGHKGGYVYNN